MRAAKTPLQAQRWPLVITQNQRSLGSSTIDGSLLRRAFATSKQRWTPEQKTATAGVATWRTRGNWKIIDPANTGLVRSLQHRSEPDGSRN